MRPHVSTDNTDAKLNIVGTTLMTGRTFSIALATVTLLATPAFAQDPNAVGGTQQNEPGTGGTSKPGTAGDVGGKNGPSAKEGSGAAANTNSGTSSATGAPAGSDNSKVPGLPGNKSGPSQKPSK
jgi:hypothetical protein